MTDFAEPDVDLARRFGGVARLYGTLGAQRLSHAHVAVVGVGGVGSWAAEALARSGVGEITLVDLDQVSESNVNRQIHALTPTLGQAKVDAMAERIAAIHPAARVHRVEDFVTADNWPGLLPPGVQGVIEACDDLGAKLTMARWALHTRVPYVCVGAAGGKRMGHAVELADLAQVTHDPLLAKLRYRLRREHGAPRDGARIGIVCAFSREAVAGPDASCAVEGDGSLNCHGYGSSVAVTATFGLCAAGWMIDRLSRA